MLARPDEDRKTTAGGADDQKECEAAPNRRYCREQAANAVGAVFAMTNRAAKNEIVAFARAADGTLTQTGRYSTRGMVLALISTPKEPRE